jgi:hypothetical protein
MTVLITELYRRLFGRSSLQNGDVIEMSEHGRQGGVSTGQPYKFIDFLDYAIKITESGNYTYIACANPGTLENEAKWRAMKIDESSGFRITWADSNTDFDNEATDLTTLEYS